MFAVFASSAPPPLLARAPLSRAATTTDVCAQCSFGNIRTLRRLSLCTSRTRRDSLASPLACARRTSEPSTMTFVADRGISRKSTCSAMASASGTR